MLERKSRKMNYSGIILYVQGSSGNVVLSGDSLPVQTKQVLMSRMLYVSFQNWRID